MKAIQLSFTTISFKWALEVNMGLFNIKNG